MLKHSITYGKMLFVRVRSKKQKKCLKLKIFKGGAAGCQENVKFVVRVRFQEILYPTQTDTQEESGMLTFRESESMITELLEELMYAQDASDQTKSTVPSNLIEPDKDLLIQAGLFFTQRTGKLQYFLSLYPQYIRIVPKRTIHA